MKKFNVGCGGDYREGWINLDMPGEEKRDITFNLEDIINKNKKLPFEDNYFDYIYCSHVLEHITIPLPILKEFYRVCKINGKMEIHVPYGIWVFCILDHKRMFFLSTFETVTFEYRSNYVTEKIEDKIKLIHKSIYTLPIHNPLKKVIYGIMIPVINFLIKYKTSYYDQTFLKSFISNTNIKIIYRKLE